jgi:23S rRNA maturation mini-RNase III
VELMRATLSRLVTSVRLTLSSRDAVIEHEARALVQKLARESAAVHGANVARMERSRAAPMPTSVAAIEFAERIAKLDRRARNARIFRDAALVNLRRALDLPDDPTQAEIADWGEAP